MFPKSILICGALVALSVFVYAIQRKMFCIQNWNVVIDVISFFLWPSSAHYIDACYRDDPEVNACLIVSANKLARLLQNGIPELGMEEVSG